MVINGGLAITKPTLLNWTVNSPNYNQTVTTSGGTPPLTFSVSVGSLPNGLSLNPATGAITGTPTMAGTFTFTILATDAANATASKAYTVVINNTLTITAATLANWTVNQTGYSQTVTTSGGTTPLTFARLRVAAQRPEPERQHRRDQRHAGGGQPVHLHDQGYR